MYPKKTNGKKSPRSQSETAAPSPRPAFAAGGRRVPIIHFTPDAAGKFGDMTGANVQKRMAIVLDDRILSLSFVDFRAAPDDPRQLLGDVEHDGADHRAPERALAAQDVHRE